MLVLYQRYFSYLAGRFIKLLANPRILAWAGVFAFLSLTLVPANLSAANLKPRKVTISTSARGNVTGIGDNVTYTFDFTIPSTTILQSAQFLFCTASSGSCTTPTGLVTNNATLGTVTGLGDAGWVIDETGEVDGTLKIRNTGNTTAPSNVTTQVVFNTIVNPTVNDDYYIKITTFSDDAYTTTVDTGTVAFAITNQITLTGFMPESLTFCVSEDFSTDEDCTSATGDNTIDFGDFDSLSTRSAFSEMIAATNAENGYIITINGTTLTSGTNTIPALAVQTCSDPGTSQFGVNLRNNGEGPPPGGACNQPNIGRDPTTPVNAIGTYSANYGTIDQFRFVTGDTVAQSVEETNSNTFTVSYIVNVEPRQAAGTYTSTMTYICTATF